MEKVKITSDSVCDLSPELIEENGLDIIPLHVSLDDVDHKDGIDITPADIFAHVKKTGHLPKTSACSVDEYERFFEKHLETNESVIVFCISSKCSSSYENAVAAAKKFDGRAYPIDSEHLSTGQGLLVMKAVDLKNEGLSAPEIVERIEELKKKVQTSFVVDTTEYLYKGGRCTGAARIVTKLLSIHPAIRMADGALGVKRKYMGSLKRCIVKYVSDLAEEFPDYDDTRVFITHSCCSDDIVDAVRQEVVEKFKFKTVNETLAGSVVTSHCGQGTLGVLFITK